MEELLNWMFKFFRFFNLLIELINKKAETSPINVLPKFIYKLSIWSDYVRMAFAI